MSGVKDLPKFGEQGFCIPPFSKSQFFLGLAWMMTTNFMEI